MKNKMNKVEDYVFMCQKIKDTEDNDGLDLLLAKLDIMWDALTEKEQEQAKILIMKKNAQNESCSLIEYKSKLARRLKLIKRKKNK